MVKIRFPAGRLMFFNQDEIHVSKVIVNKPYEVVWAQIANPANYSVLYPNWVRSVKKLDEAKYLVNDQFGGSYPVEAILAKEHGVVDLKIGAEVSRARLMALDSDSTAVLHLAKRWKGLSSIGWFFHKWTTDRDLENAKRIIEVE